ncbi:MAG: hypothetical protein ACLFTI_06260 [Anaerolineales bacterium]
MKQYRRWAWIGWFLLLTLACNFGRGAPEPGEVTPEKIVTSEASGEGATFSLEISNQTPYEICYIFISESDAEYWGDDWLADEGVIGVGEVWIFEVPEGSHDVLAQDCEQVPLGTAWEVDTARTITLGGDNVVPLRVVNDTDTDICYMFIADVSQEEWGEDELGKWEVIDLSGGERIFFVEPGVYDLMAADCDSNTLEETYDVEIRAEELWRVTGAGTAGDDEPAGGDEPPPSSGEDFTLSVVNEMVEDVCYVHISPTNADTWGDDWLGNDDTIGVGESRDFFVEAGSYDVMLANCDEAVVETGWSIGSDTTMRPGSSGDIPLEVVNESSADICYLYISPTTSDEWGEDWMGEQEIISQGSARIFYVDAGRYDMTAEDCDGEILAEENEVNIQEWFTWTLSD